MSIKLELGTKEINSQMREKGDRKENIVYKMK